MNEMYFDSAATTKVKDEVLQAMLPYFTEKFYNPSSLYLKARKVKKDIEEARANIADFINAEPDEIYFTSGASESNSWVLQGFLLSRSMPDIVVSDIEHKSIIEFIDNSDFPNIYIIDNTKAKTKEGKITNLFFDSFVALKTADVLCSIQTANNEIGTIQDIKTLCDIAHKRGYLLHTDATQAFGQIPIDVKKLGVDFLSASGHKIGAPKGIGILYIKKGTKISPLIYGTQQNGLRGGTENVPYIIGLSKAVSLKREKLKPEYIAFKNRCRDEIIDRLVSEFGCKLNGTTGSSRLPNNINITFPQNITGESLVYMLDTDGIIVSSGSACNSYSNKHSHVLKAIGLSDSEAMRTIRITLPDEFFDMPYKDKQEEINYFIDKLKKAIKAVSI